MKHISILVPKGAVALSTIEGPFIAFTKANEILQSLGRPALFKVQLVGLTKEMQSYHRFFKVTPDHVITDTFKTDLVIIPAVNGNMKEVIANNADFFPWINKQHKDGGEVASLCVGTFLLASTGLLEGKKCATHWLAVQEFRNLFPDIELVSDKIITDEHGVYSSGGANSFWNLILYIIEKYAGREVAIACSKIFEIEIDRSSQAAFIMFKGQRDHQDESILKAQEFIEHNFQEKITVDQLSTMFAMGRRSLERRFKKATRNTVSEYIQRVKIEAARKVLRPAERTSMKLWMTLGIQTQKHSEQFLNAPQDYLR